MNNIKSFIKRNYKLGISFILGMIVCMGIGVSAVATKEVVYDNSKSGLTSTNLQGAIDELNEKAKVCGNKLCQRATFLHTETCSQTSTSDYCNADGYSTGDTITYGNLGIKGTLITGDAFDCDVNGDGIYNATNQGYTTWYDFTKKIYELRSTK